MDTNRETAYLSQNEDNFPNFSLGQEFLNSNFQQKIKPIPILLNISLIAYNHFWYCCPFFALDLMHNSSGYVIKQLVHALCYALSNYGALRKLGEHFEGSEFSVSEFS